MAPFDPIAPSEYCELWARIDADGCAVPVLHPSAGPFPVNTKVAPDTFVVVGRPKATTAPWTLRRVLAAPGTARWSLYGILAKNGIDPIFSARSAEEVRLWLSAPGIDDPTLRDLESLPFVTVDGAKTRDLDQAAFVRHTRSGYDVFYALADASYFVRPGTALWDEALRRGASYYLPGLTIPMLPRELSEGLISLNPGERRRALVLHTELTTDGTVRHTSAFRARIRSRHKLSFRQVQRFYDAPGGMDFEPGVAASLRALKEVGKLRMSLAAERNVVRFRRVELEARLDDGQGQRFVSMVALRDEVEAYNEQLSLLCNAEGARLLKDAANQDYVEPIFRVHPPPEPARLEELRQLVVALVAAQGLGREWLWTPEQALSDYLRNLPRGPEAPIAAVIHRQAVMTNLRSTFQTSPGAHFGVGADPYARFSAPMREVVGIYLHGELLQAQSGAGGTDEDLRERVTQRANSARQLQRCVTNEANLLILDQLFGPQLLKPRAERGLPARIMGLSASRAYVQLDAPPIDAKVEFRDMRDELRAPALALAADGCRVLANGRTLFVLGDPVRVIVLSQDLKRKRWHLSLEGASPLH